MANLEVNQKVNYVGVWLENVFTDALVQTIAGYAKAEKGKKVKITLNSFGLRITKTKIFHEDKTEFYPLSMVRTIARNPRHTACVMLILTDPRMRYKIIAVRCFSEGDAIYLTNMFSRICEPGALPGNVELKKQDNGNWTLRERSAHNANRHLTEVFNEPNGGGVVRANGDASHIPVLDRSKTQTNGDGTVNTYYVKRLPNHEEPKQNKYNNNHFTSNGDQYKPTVFQDGDDYVLETEVSADPYPNSKASNTNVTLHAQSRPVSEEDVAAFKGDLDHISQEVREIKAILESVAVNDRQDNDHPSKVAVSPRGYSEGVYALPSKPNFVTADRSRSGSLAYRAYPSTNEGRLLYVNDPWASHKRLSRDFAIPTRDQPHSGIDSGHSSIRVKFDSGSVRSTGSHKKDRTLRLKSEYSVPTTVQRSIEDTYARPTIIRRHGSGHVVRARPSSYHVVGNNELRVYQSLDRHMDVAL